MFVRTGTEADVAAIARIFASGRRDAAAVTLPPGDDELGIEAHLDGVVPRRALRAPHDWHGWLVAVADDAVVAAGAGGMASPTTGEVFSLLSTPDRGGSGARASLLRTMTAQQVVAGAREQRASCPAGDDDLRSFYRDHGFEVTARESGAGSSGETLRLARRV